MAQRKIFVLDTNVVLHDSSCVHHFDEHDVVIPITVLEELDRFKKGEAILNFHAREFVRTLDGLSAESCERIFNGGVEIGTGKGRIAVKLERPFHRKVADNFCAQKPDHHILNTAYHLAEEQRQRPVVLVTKDVNLRMKARAMGLLAEDYTTDHVKDVTALYRGHRVEENIPGALIDRFYTAPYEVAPTELDLADRLVPNEYLVLRNGQKSALGNMSAARQSVRRVDKKSAFGIAPRNVEQSFALDALLDPEIPMVTISGKAGTGKTLLALAASLENRKNYRQILVARPVVPLSNKDIGYLPGDVQSKLDPYMQPLHDNLAVIQDRHPESRGQGRRVSELLETGKMVITPLTYIRGRSLVKVFFIVDEAQNLTPHEVKTIITRAGEDTKMVFTGDIFQIDHPYLDSQSNGLSFLIEKMKGQHLAAHVNLEKGERSELSELAIDLL